MPVSDSPTDGTLDQLETLTLEHARLAEHIKALEAEKKTLSLQIRDILGANGVNKWGNDQFVVTMMYPAPRTSIDREKLLLHGVSVEVIQASTKVTPVDPFVRIDPRQKGKGKGDE